MPGLTHMCIQSMPAGTPPQTIATGIVVSANAMPQCARKHMRARRCRALDGRIAPSAAIAIMMPFAPTAKHRKRKASECVRKSGNAATSRRSAGASRRTPRRKACTRSRARRSAA